MQDAHLDGVVVGQGLAAGPQQGGGQQRGGQGTKRQRLAMGRGHENLLAPRRGSLLWDKETLQGVRHSGPFTIKTL